MPIVPYPDDPDWPSDWEGCALTGRFIDILGNPMAGSITIAPSPGAMVDVTNKVIVIAATRTVTLDENGAFSIMVPATDDPDVNPTGWTYKISETWPGGRIYHIEAPLGATLDLSEIIPIGPANGTAITRGKSAYEIAVEEGFSGTQAEWIASLSGADPELIRDTVAALLVAGANVTLTNDDPGNTLTIASSGGGGGLDTEAVQDAVAGMIVAGTNVTATYDDTAGTLTLASTGGGGGLDAEAVQDVVGAMLVAGTGVTLNYDDTAGTVTITGAGIDAEAVRDTIGAALVGSGVISVTVDDGGDTITISSTATANATDAALRDRATHTGTQAAATISDFTEAVQDAVAAFLTAGTGATLTYDDGANTLTVAATGGVSSTTLNDELRKTDANAFYSGGAYPTRASVTADTARRVRWIGPTAPTIGGSYAIDGLDVWESA